MSTKIERKAYARAGLLGNPSDGYNGKTISFSVRNFSATVVLTPAPRLRIVPGLGDETEYQSITELVQTVKTDGYYGGVRLVKAAIVEFNDRFSGRNAFHDRNFEISYSTNIPRNVGLAGSSAIVIAALRGLSDFCQITVEPSILAAMALRVERHQLGIPAGLQDRVIQSFEGLVYMDFGIDQVTTGEGLTIGHYESMEPDLLTNVYIAYSEQAGEPTEVTHQSLRQRFDSGDGDVVEAMMTFAQLAEKGKQVLLDGDQAKLSDLINQNFDLRSRICHINPLHRRMIEIARETEASSKFCGSGGAIVGTYRDPEAYELLVDRLGKIGCRVFQPQIKARQPHGASAPD